MTRTIRTLLLSAATSGALATTTIAAPTAPLGSRAANEMPSMHTTTTAHPHAVAMTDPAIHNAMLNGSTMLAHLAEYGINVDHMRRWHDEGRSVNDMHASLTKQGIDTNAMPTDCPMRSNESMATMHSDNATPTQTASNPHRRGDPK